MSSPSGDNCVADKIDKDVRIDPVAFSFESLVVFLREKETISVSRSCLQRIHLLCTFRHGSPSKALAPENVNVKVFLAGYMIVYRPTHAFESMGSLEQALLDAATLLLTTFQKICSCIRSSPGRCFQDVPHELTKGFPTMLFEYLKHFKAWKVPDQAKLTCRIKHALIALYQAEEHLPPDEPDDSKLKVEFRTQIERLRGKLQQIAGADALEQFDEQRRAGQIPGGSSGEATGRLRVGGGAGGAGGAYAALPGRMTNEQLAHELLLDPTFQLDESGGCSVENAVFQRIRESFHQAFWDSLVDDLRLAAPCYVRVLRVLAEIRDGISDLAGSREAGRIAEAVDLDFIRQQAEVGLYTWDSCSRLMGSVVGVIQVVQAPKREGETLARWKEVERGMREAGPEERPRALCRALEFLLDRVNAMRIDAANARLRLIAPVIKDHGVDYERGKFQDKLSDGSLTLERTQAWVRASVRREVACRAVELGGLLEGKASAFMHVHSAGVLALVAQAGPLRVDECPETLLLDVQRLGGLQRELQQAAAAATMLVTAAHTVTTTKNASDVQALAAISDLLVTDNQHPDQVLLDVERALEGTSLSADGRRALMLALTQCAAPTDAVHQLIAKRIRDLLGQMMRDGKPPADLGSLRVAAAVVPRIEKVAAKLAALANLNRTVHLPTYKKLIGEEARRLHSEPPGGTTAVGDMATAA